jgi:hypothetical protein
MRMLIASATLSLFWTAAAALVRTSVLSVTLFRSPRTFGSSVVRVLIDLPVRM